MTNQRDIDNRVRIVKDQLNKPNAPKPGTPARRDLVKTLNKFLSSK